MNRSLLIFTILSCAQVFAQTELSISASAEDNPDAEEDLITLTSLDNQPTTQDGIPYDELRTFVDVFDSVKKHYIDETSNEELMDNAIRGMISRLDPHSAFFNESEYQAFKEQTAGDYAGIGVVLDFQEGAIKVITAIPGSPAERAGIQSDDIISFINQQSVQDMTLQQAADSLEGEPGSDIDLGILRGDEMINTTVTREIIHTDSVAAEWLSPGILRVAISQFQEDTATSLQDIITEYLVQGNIQGLILDLRNNPGGYLTSAVDTADIFLNQGDILSVRDRQNSEQQQYSASDGDMIAGAPIVILVNRGTASGAEIVAAALQDNRRALVVGQQTFGKGSVQTLLPLYNGGAVKLTTAKYYTPSGSLIQARGIKPDITLANLATSIQENGTIEEREATLYNHIDNTDQQSNDGQGKAELNTANNLAASDFMLYQALNILNTMIMTNAHQPQ